MRSGSGQWQHSDRRARLPSHWPRLRQWVLARDGYRCTAAAHEPACDGTATDVDHVDRDGGDGVANLTSLSAACHKAKTQREAQAARVFTRRAPEVHPGLNRARRT